jgi:hypothetical protein
MRQLRRRTSLQVFAEYAPPARLADPADAPSVSWQLIRIPAIARDLANLR